MTFFHYLTAYINFPSADQENEDRFDISQVLLVSNNRKYIVRNKDIYFGYYYSH